MTFEEKIRLLIATPPGDKKQELLNKFSSEPEFASRYYLDAMSLDKYMEVNAERFAPIAAKAKYLREQMRNKGWTDKKYQKYTGEIPEPLFQERQEFAASLPKKILDRNIRLFLERYPAFRVDK